MKAKLILAIALAAVAAVPAAAQAAAPAKDAPALKSKAEAAKPSAIKDQRGVSRRMAGRRDPFVSIIREAAPEGPPCVEGGKKCLHPDRMTLRGIVISDEDAIAVVETAQKRTYMLRRGDLIQNGEVARITDDAVILRMRATDRVGRVSTREVVKRLARSTLFPEGVSGQRPAPGGGTGSAGTSGGGSGASGSGLQGLVIAQ